MGMIGNNGMFLGRVQEEPIMSFQTAYNGTFTPVITPDNGTLKWVVDGVEQITNTPSYDLTGNTVQVEVYANNVKDGEIVTIVEMDDLNIIGSLSFSHFTLNASLFAISTNSEVDNILFRVASNLIQLAQFNDCGFVSLDFTNVTFSGGNVNISGNASLASVIFSSTTQSISDLRFNSCAFTAIDLSNIQFNGSCIFNSNPNLSSIIFGDSVCLGALLGYDCALTSLDLSNVTFSNATSLYAYNNMMLSEITFDNVTSQSISDIRLPNCNLITLNLTNIQFTSRFWAYSNPNLSSIIFGVGSNSIAMQLQDCNLTSLDLSNVNFSTGVLYVNSNPNLSSITFNNSTAQNITELRGYNCNLLTVDLTNFTITSSIQFNSNISLASISLPLYTTGLGSFNVQNCALDLTTIDSIFATLNTYFSANAPIKLMTVVANEGTNASPSDGVNNIDIVNLDTVIYPTAGFNFIYTIN